MQPNNSSSISRGPHFPEVGGAEYQSVPPSPFRPRPLIPRLIAGKNQEALAPSPVEIKVVALTGTGLGSSTCYPPSIGCPARPLGSAVQPSVPPLPPPPPAAQSLAWPRLPCPPPSATLVGCLDLHWKVGVRSEGVNCQDSELIRKAISGACWHCVLQKRKLKTENGDSTEITEGQTANRGGAGRPDHLLVPRPLLLTINNTTPQNEICHTELTRAKHLASHLALVCAQ